MPFAATIPDSPGQKLEDKRKTCPGCTGVALQSSSMAGRYLDGADLAARVSHPRVVRMLLLSLVGLGLASRLLVVRAGCLLSLVFVRYGQKVEKSRQKVEKTRPKPRETRLRGSPGASHDQNHTKKAPKSVPRSKNGPKYAKTTSDPPKTGPGDRFGPRDPRRRVDPPLRGVPPLKGPRFALTLTG